ALLLVNTGAVSLGASSAGSSLAFSTTGALTITGAVTAPLISLGSSNSNITIGANIGTNTTTSVDLNPGVTGNIVQSAPGALVTAGTVNLNGSAGSVGTSGASIKTAANTLSAT